MDALGRARGERRRAGEDKADSGACRGRRGDLDGHARSAQGRLEASGGPSYSASVHCSVLQSVPLAGMLMSLLPGRVPQCPVVLGSSKQWGGSLGCSGEPLK